MRSPRPQTKPADTLHILRHTLLRQTRSTLEPASHRLSNVVGGGGRAARFVNPKSPLIGGSGSPGSDSRSSKTNRLDFGLWRGPTIRRTTTVAG